MFAVRIVTADYYLASPIKGLDPGYSEFRDSEVKKVPVVRIFGATPAGQSLFSLPLEKTLSLTHTLVLSCNAHAHSGVLLLFGVSRPDTGVACGAAGRCSSAVDAS